MRPEIQAIVDTHRLAPEVARDLHAVFGTLLSALPTLGSAASFELRDPDGGATLDAASEVTEEVTSAQVGSVPPRYEDIGRIGVGGMGEVRRVRDRELGRTCAYKAIHGDLLGNRSVVARFVEEAQIGAQLQHPNIPPVYDAGQLPDGRPWFTLKEVRGRTFGEQIREAHAGEVTDVALRRLVDVLAKVCDAVGYAHGRGVVHRDLKPDNVMVGSHGEVFVLDWGLAKVVGRPDLALEEGALEPGVATARGADESMKTRVGGVLGTAAYMPPEQARGEVDRLDARADVYALGAILYEALSGRPPYEGRDARAVLRQVLAGPPEPPGRATGPAGGLTFGFGLEALEVEEARQPLPEELVSLSMRCLSREPEERPPDGSGVGAVLRAWLDGAGKRAKALEVVAEAEAVVAEAAALREQAMVLRTEGPALLASVKPWAPEEEKALGWSKQDEADRVERRAVMLEIKREALLRGALTHAPDLTEAHAALLELERSRHASAEGARDEGGAARAEVQLLEHLEALPERHPMRVGAAGYLKGDGALTLDTDPPGAEVLLYRYEQRNRRLVEVPVGSLGRTPLRAVPLAMGSYLCVLQHPERAEVRYPVHLGRGEHWDCVPPGERAPLPVRLPRVGELGPDDRLVPAGWFWAGGNPDAPESLSRRRLWCDELVAKRFPVTNREYVAFLDALVATGREAEAERHQPRERTAAGEGAPVYGRDDAGRFVLRADPEGDVWDPDWPVFLVDWFGATAYAAWLAEATGRPWRLPGELEWEKAARGVDGRHYPWGDFCDPSWTCVGLSHPGRPLPTVVDSFPVDASVYGVRGVGGNVEEWCVDVFRREGAPVDGTRVPSLPRGEVADVTSARCFRGGYWYGTARDARSASRFRSGPWYRNEGLGLRVVSRPDPTLLRG